jgi:hypothetical protein
MIDMEQTITEFITTEAELREILGHPSEMIANKVIPILDKHCKAFIAHSPYMLIASSDADGNMDVSPKGDPTGFVQVLDDKTLAIPDRLGNRRIDTLTNILQNDRVGLIFLIPDKSELLRVSGRARIARDLWLRETMTMKGKIPNVALIVTVESAMMHCSKSVIRSNLWKPDHWQDFSDIASLSQMLIDHSNLTCSVEELDDLIDNAYKNQLY